MTDKKPDHEKQATPKGAVEIDEEQLEQAAGGAGDDLPLESISLNYSKAEVDYMRKAGGDPQLSPEKKI